MTARQIRVAYVGNFEPSHSTENHYAVSFEAAGCAVLRLQENDLPANVAGMVAANGVDLLLYTRTWDVEDEGFRWLISNPPDGVVTAAVHLDRFTGLARDAEIDTGAMWRAQHVFTPDGDTPAFWEAHGVNHHWLPPAVVDPALVSEIVPAEPARERWPYEIAFVGSRGYHEEWPREQFVGACEQRFGDRFAHIGGDGITGRRIVEHELNEIYATVPVIVGDSCFADWSSCYWSDRFYETWGRGGYLVFPAIHRLGLEVGGYPSWEPGDYESLFDAVEWALDRPAYRDRWRDRIGGHVRAHATYTDRARTILRTVGLTS